MASSRCHTAVTPSTWPSESPESRRVSRGSVAMVSVKRRYKVNFVPELALIIKEAKYLDRLGFSMPETALQIALQEDKFHAYQRDLSLKLSQYDSLISRIAPVESDLLTRQVAILQRNVAERLHAVELEL